MMLRSHMDMHRQLLMRKEDQISRHKRGEGLALGLHTPYPIGIHTDTHMHTNMHTHIDTHMHTHIDTHMHTHTHAHTHTHTDDYVILKQMHLYYRKFYFYSIDSFDLWLFG